MRIKWMATVSTHGWMAKRWKDFFPIFCVCSQVFTFRHRFHWTVHAVYTSKSEKFMGFQPAARHHVATTQKMASFGHAHTATEHAKAYFLLSLLDAGVHNDLRLQFQWKSVSIAQKFTTNYGKMVFVSPTVDNFLRLIFHSFASLYIFIYCCDAFSVHAEFE